MLSYAFQVLEQNNYEYIAKEDFEIEKFEKENGIVVWTNENEKNS